MSLGRPAGSQSPRLTRTSVRTSLTALAAAALAATSLGGLAGCDADDSAPFSPRQPFLGADERANDAAKRREEEKRQRELPTGGGSEFPGQSDARPRPGTTPGAVLTAADFPDPQARSTSPTAWGTLPHLHTQPKDHFAEGYTIVPGLDESLAAGHDWGQVLPLANTPRRNWNPSTVSYVTGVANHNPTYYTLLADRYPNLALFQTPDTGYGSLSSPGAANANTVSSPGSTVGGVNGTTGTPGVTSGGTAGAATVAPGVGVTGGTTGGTAGSAGGTAGGTDTAGAAAGTGGVTGTAGTAGTAGGTQGGFLGNFSGVNLAGQGTAGLNAIGLSTSGVGIGSSVASLGSDLVEAPWFLVQTIALPVRMIQRHPWSLVQSRVPVADPVYTGFLPDSGPIFPSAYPGEVRWVYPWTRNPGEPPTTGPTTLPVSTPDMEPRENP